MADDDVTKAQAAALLGCHVGAVHDLMARGALPSRRVGFVHLLPRHRRWPATA